MFCTNCGKEIRDGAAFCSSCGASQQEETTQTVFSAVNTNSSIAQGASYNTMCVLGAVISGISLLLNFWGIVGIAGTIVSTLGLMSCQQKKEKGKMLAITGIGVGACSILYALVELSKLM
jgi:hypothetical protein